MRKFMHPHFFCFIFKKSCGLQSCGLRFILPLQYVVARIPGATRNLYWFLFLCVFHLFVLVYIMYIYLYIVYILYNIINNKNKKKRTTLQGCNL